MLNHDIMEFLRVWERLTRHDATQRYVRGYGALEEKDYPNESCIRVVDWLRDKIEGHILTNDIIDKQQKHQFSRRIGLCCCWKCIGEREELCSFMVLCPICGNKRCPKASDHTLDCTKSNEPGQPGSLY